MNVMGGDKVAAALVRIDAYESKACGIRHDDGPQPGSSYELDPKAQRVDVGLEDFDFVVDGPIHAGPTSFVATNKGKQAHFLGLVKLKDGVTLDQAIQSEDQSGIDGFWESRIAAAGGDQEILTVDLQPGQLRDGLLPARRRRHAARARGHEVPVHGVLVRRHVGTAAGAATRGAARRSGTRDRATAGR